MSLRWTGLLGAPLVLVLAAGVDECIVEPTCLRYDQIQQIDMHNAFGEELSPVDEQILDLIVTHRIRSIELDLHPHLVVGQPPPVPDWYILHTAANNAMSNVVTLREALSLIRSWHQVQPDHEVLTINLELGSSDPGKGGAPEFQYYDADALNQLLIDELGANVLYTPQNLLDRKHSPTLADAVLPIANDPNSSWPTVDELRGRVIVLIAGVKADQDLFFDAPTARAAFRIDLGDWADPAYIAGLHDNPNLVFHSQVGEEDDGAALRAEFPGHLFRTASVDDCADGCTPTHNHDRFSKAQADGMQFLLMNAGSMHDPLFRVHNDHRYPFAASYLETDGTYPVGGEAWQKPTVVGKGEPGNYVEIVDAGGGDIWDDSDRFTFYYLPSSQSPETWTTMISTVSNDTIHPMGKGFVMARASLAPDAVYCAAGKTADRYGPRAQWRTGIGVDTQMIEPYGDYLTANIPNRRDRENEAFVKLEVVPVPSGVTCREYHSMSGDADDWQLIGEQTLPVASLPFVGLAVANNSGFNADNVYTYSPTTPNPFLFVGTKRLRDGVVTDVLPTALTRWEVDSSGWSWRLEGPETAECVP